MENSCFILGLVIFLYFKPFHSIPIYDVIMGISPRWRIQIYVCFFNPELFVHEKWSTNRYSLGTKFVGKKFG